MCAANSTSGANGSSFKRKLPLKLRIHDEITSVVELNSISEPTKAISCQEDVKEVLKNAGYDTVGVFGARFLAEPKPRRGFGKGLGRRDSGR